MNGNLSQYRIFAVAAETGSISGAARKLYISQPAVSKSIISLEESMGVRLLERGSRGVILTEEGRILYKHVSEAFRFLEAGENEIRRYSDLGIGHLTIGASTTLCRYVLLPYLSAFSMQYPHISLGISCQPSRQTLEMIYSTNVDIGLVARQDDMNNIDFYSLGQINDIFAASPAYLRNMAIRSNDPAVEGAVDLLLSGQAGEDFDGLTAVLNHSTLLLLDKDNGTRRFVDYFLEENHIHPENLIETTTMDLLIDFTRTGLGIGAMIEEFVRDDIENGRLVRIPTGAGIAPREIGFAWSRDRTSHASIETFMNFIRKHE